MEFVTGSELNFPFARNVAALARQTVEKASQSESHTPIPRVLEHGSEQEMDMPSQVSEVICSTCRIIRLNYMKGSF